MTGELCPRCSAPPRTDGAPSCRCDALAAEREAEIAASEDFDPLRLRPYVALGDDPAGSGHGPVPPPLVRLPGDLIPVGSPILSGEPLYGRSPLLGGGGGPAAAGDDYAERAEPPQHADDTPPYGAHDGPAGHRPGPGAPPASPPPEFGRNGPPAPPDAHHTAPSEGRPPHGPPPRSRQRHRRRKRPAAALATLTTGAAAAVACAVAISTGLLGGDRDDGGERALTRDRTSAPPPEEMPDEPAHEPPSASAAPPPSLPAAAPRVPAARASRAAPPARTAVPRRPGPATAGPAEPSPLRSTPPPRPPAVRVLRIGMRGADVADMQRRLEQTGIWYEAGADGYFGAAERRAVADYQRVRSITTDPAGVYGPRTRSTLEAETDGR